MIIRSLKLAAPLAIALMFSGCATTSTDDITKVISDVQKATVTICGFLPTAATIASILTAGNPLVSSVSTVAEAICAAVTAPPPPASAKGAKRTAPVVSGVVVHGKFVR